MALASVITFTLPILPRRTYWPWPKSTSWAHGPTTWATALATPIARSLRRYAGRRDARSQSYRRTGGRAIRRAWSLGPNAFARSWAGSPATPNWRPWCTAPGGGAGTIREDTDSDHLTHTFAPQLCRGRQRFARLLPP